MADPWGLASMNAFIDSGDAQLVLVQYVFRRSASILTARLPSARAAWRAIRSA